MLVRYCLLQELCHVTPPCRTRRHRCRGGQRLQCPVPAATPLISATGAPDGDKNEMADGGVEDWPGPAPRFQSIGVGYEGKGPCPRSLDPAVRHVWKRALAGAPLAALH